MYAGYLEEGDRCPDVKCQGTMQFPEVENCSCHISAPCSPCTNLKLTCDCCGWVDDSPEERYIVVAPGLSIVEQKPKPLDKTKIDFRSQMHTGCSMKKIGVYPQGTTMDEVRKVVNGTFGGRFDSFGDGKFVFIAYTD